jgi:Arc/MetJ-type ribon-helix-helix transcriptional regulator
MTDTTEPTKTVEVPKHVVDRIEARLPYTNYESADEYVSVALEGLLRELDTASTEAWSGDEDREDVDVDADAVEERLNSLGYL